MNMAPKFRRAGLQGRAVQSLGVTYLCLCQRKTWEEDKKKSWGDMGTGQISQVCLLLAFLGTEEDEGGREEQKEHWRKSGDPERTSGKRHRVME